MALRTHSIFVQTLHKFSVFTVIQYLSYFHEFYHNSSAIVVATIPGEKPPASDTKMEKGLFDFSASRKTRHYRQHCFAAVDFEELILLF